MGLEVLSFIVLFWIMWAVYINLKGIFLFTLAFWNRIQLNTILSAYADTLYQYDYLELFKSIILSLDFSLGVISFLIWTLIRKCFFDIKEPLILIKDYKLLNLICLFLIISIPIEMVIFLIKNWGFLSFTEEGVELKSLITLMNSLNFKLFIFISIEFIFSFLLLFASMNINNKVALTLTIKLIFGCTVDLFDLLKHVLFTWKDIDTQLEKIVLFLNRDKTFSMEGEKNNKKGPCRFENAECSIALKNWYAAQSSLEKLMGEANLGVSIQVRPELGKKMVLKCDAAMRCMESQNPVQFSQDVSLINKETQASKLKLKESLEKIKRSMK